MSTLKNIQSITTAKPQQVGDGFIGKNAFHPQQAKPFSPFLLLDHHGPMQVSPSEKQRGVDEHPHRGFETVTIVYEGALEHRDSAGNNGKLFPGDVQWMTAASGIVHEEKHEKEFSKGGTLNFVQLWVNLPAAYKMTQPRYQELAAAQFPSKDLSKGAILRVIAGDLMGLQGAAQTFSPVIVADSTMQATVSAKLTIPEGFNFLLYMLDGEAVLKQKEKIEMGQIATFLPGGDTVEIVSHTDAKVLLLAGEPINEPLATYGPFVMNSVPELQQAIADFQAGKMGQLVH